MSGSQAILAEAEAEASMALNRRVAERDGSILPVQAVAPAALTGATDDDLDRVLQEVAITINMPAAGGNASLMSTG